MTERNMTCFKINDMTTTRLVFYVGEFKCHDNHKRSSH